MGTWDTIVDAVVPTSARGDWGGRGSAIAIGDAHAGPRTGSRDGVRLRGIYTVHRAACSAAGKGCHTHGDHFIGTERFHYIHEPYSRTKGVFNSTRPRPPIPVPSRLPASHLRTLVHASTTIELSCAGHTWHQRPRARRPFSLLAQTCHGSRASLRSAASHGFQRTAAFI